jgi:signal transduction histidine kinase
MSERLSRARLLHRRGVRGYLLTCVVIVWAFSLSMCALITVVIGGLYLELSGEHLWTALAIAEAGTVCGLGLSLTVSARRARPLLRCMEGDRAEGLAEAAWEAGAWATFWPPALAASACSLLTIPAQLYVLSVAPIPAWQMVVVVAPVVQFGIVATAMLAYFTGESFLAPLVAEISQTLPPEFEPRTWQPRLRARLLPTVLVVDIFASIFAGGLVSRASGPTEALVFSLLAGLTINLTFSLTWTLALAGSVLRPVRNLLQGARAVENNDLAVRVPLVGNDELTGLSRTFNLMVAGLRDRLALRSENEELLGEVRASRARLVAASDAERRRVERNLHDGAQQRLVGLSLRLSILEDSATDEATRRRAGAAKEKLGTALTELRELARGLHPQVLSTGGLAPALRQLAERSPVPATVEAPQGRYPDAIESTAYFVASEALANVAKYAEATAAEVLIERRNGELVLEVSDDGIGGASASSGSGLAGLADRVAALDGELAIRSPAGRGTTVRVALPLTEGVEE